MRHVEEGRLHAYLDGECGDVEAAEIDVHVAACAECEAAMDAAAHSRALSSRLLAELMPDDSAQPAWETMLARAAARAETEEPEHPRPWIQRATPAVAWAATLVLAFFLGWTASRSAPEISPTSPAEGPIRAARPAGPAELERDEASSAETFRDAADEQLNAAPADAPAMQESRLQAAAEPEPTVSEVQPPAAEQAPPTTLPQQAAVPPPAGAPVAERRAAVDQVGEARLAEERAAGGRIADDRDANERADDVSAAKKTDVVEEPVATGEREELADLLVTAGAVSSPEGFNAIDESAVVDYLGVVPVGLPDAELIAVESGPASRMRGGVPGLAVIRLRYRLDDGTNIDLLLQRDVEIGRQNDSQREGALDRSLRQRAQPDPRAEPAEMAARESLDALSGADYETERNSLAWLHPAGLRAEIVGPVSESRLRALAASVR